MMSLLLKIIRGNDIFDISDLLHTIAEDMRDDSEGFVRSQRNK
jgi:hypothetical protein